MSNDTKTESPEPHVGMVVNFTPPNHPWGQTPVESGEPAGFPEIRTTITKVHSSRVVDLEYRHGGLVQVLESVELHEGGGLTYRWRPSIKDELLGLRSGIESLIAERDAAEARVAELEGHLRRVIDDLVLYHPQADVIPPANAVLTPQKDKTDDDV